MAWNNENITPSVTQETDAALVALGQRGCVVIYNESAATGNFAAVQCITDSTFTSLDTVEGSNENSPFFPLVDNTITIPAGTVLYGPFTYVEIGSLQAAICYKA